MIELLIQSHLEEGQYDDVHLLPPRRMLGERVVPGEAGLAVARARVEFVAEDGIVGENTGELQCW